MRYFKVHWDSQLGPGTIWHEFDGEQSTRQAECYAGRWFSSREDHHPELGPALAQGPLSDLDVGPEHEIGAAEFERAWTASEHAASEAG